MYTKETSRRKNFMTDNEDLNAESSTANADISRFILSESMVIVNCKCLLSG